MSKFVAEFTSKEMAEFVYQKYGRKLGTNFNPTHVYVTLDEPKKTVRVELEERY